MLSHGYFDHVMGLDGLGAVVVTGCGHSGTSTSCAHEGAALGRPGLAVLGELHLTGGLFEPIIPQTVAALAGWRPTW